MRIFQTRFQLKAYFPNAPFHSAAAGESLRFSRKNWSNNVQVGLFEGRHQPIRRSDLRYSSSSHLSILQRRGSPKFERNQSRLAEEPEPQT